MSRPKAPCGTDAAYRRHLKHGESVDDACRDAHAEAGRESRRTGASIVVVTSPDDQDDDADDADDNPVAPDPADDMKLIVDTLRTVFKNVAEADPLKIAPIAREFRTAVESTRGPVEPPKEMSLVEQLAEARRARAARAQGSSASA